ncbi:hypothetical protein D3C76_1675140 [compost metagenome]
MLVVSIFRVSEMNGPQSMSLVYRVSRRTTWALAIFARTSTESSVLHSAMISPVAGCTTALATVRPIR